MHFLTDLWVDLKVSRFLTSFHMDGLTQDDSEFVSCLAVIGSHMQVTPEGFAPAMKQNDQNEYNDLVAANYRNYERYEMLSQGKKVYKPTALRCYQ